MDEDDEERVGWNRCSPLGSRRDRSRSSGGGPRRSGWGIRDLRGWLEGERAWGGAFIASADDGSSMFYNPAGLATNDKLTASIGMTLIAPFSSFDGANPYPGQGYTADQKKQIFFPPNLYVSMPVAKNVNVSLGTWFPNGLSTAWENPDTFRGRFLSQRVDLRQYAMGLQVSAALTEWLSIGAGPELRVSDVKLQKNFGTINPYTQSFSDVVHADIVGDGFATDVTFGAGIQIKPTENISLGVSYHGHVDQTYKGNAVLYQISTGHADLDGAVAAKYPLNTNVPVETTLQFPAIWMFGVAYHDCKLTIEAAATYTEWKVFDQTVFSFSPVNGKQVPSQILVPTGEHLVIPARDELPGDPEVQRRARRRLRPDAAARRRRLAAPPGRQPDRLLLRHRPEGREVDGPR